MNSKTNKMQTSVLIFTIGMLLTKFSSFLVNIALSYKYGTSYQSDAIIISMNIPTILFAGFISAISTCYVPIYKDVDISSGERKNEVTSIVINTLALIFAGFCVLIFVFPEFFIRLFAGGMTIEGIRLASSITRWVAVASLVMSTTGVLQGFLQANSRFRLVSISVLPVNIILALSIGLSTQSNIVLIIGMGFIFAYFFQFVMFFITSRKVGFKWYPVISFNDEYIRKLFAMVLPVFLGILLYDVNSIVDKSFASLLDVGSISVLDYSYKVAAAAQGIIAYPLTTILYTKLSDDGSKKDYESLATSVNSGFKRLSFFMIPSITGLIAVSDIVIRVLFFRGNFGSEAAGITSLCLILYLIGMYAISYRALFEKVFYSLQLTKMTLSNTVVTVVSNIIMDYLLYKIWGCYGLAIATSVSLIISLAYLSILMRRKIGISISKEIAFDVTKMAGAAILMLVILMVTKHFVQSLLPATLIGNLIKLAVLIIEGAAIYAGMLLLLKEPMAKSIINKYLKREVD